MTAFSSHSSRGLHVRPSPAQAPDPGAPPYVFQFEDVPPALALGGNLLLRGGRRLVLGVPEPRRAPVNLLLALRGTAR